MTPSERTDARLAAGYAAGRVPRAHPIYAMLRDASMGTNSEYVTEPVLQAVHHIIEFERRPPAVDG